MIKKTLCILATPLLLSTSTTFLTAKEPETGQVAPSEESRQLADKQIDKKMNDLKEALAGMRSAVDTGDRASFRLYRTQARTALMNSRSSQTSKSRAKLER